MRVASSVGASVWAALRRAGGLEVVMALDRSSPTRPSLALGLISTAHAVIHAQSALLPLIYPILIVEFALNAQDIGIFIAITTAVGGFMQLAHGILTRYVARPLLLAAPMCAHYPGDEPMRSAVAA